jgi:mRNA-degrading endonuclease RelE of RelBE toxin-antitoxin system
MYQVVIEKQAQKQLAKIFPPDYAKIVAALKDLTSDP